MRLGPALPVVGDREAVGLVADPLQQVEALAGAGQDHRVLLRLGQPDLLEPLGQPARRRCRRCRARSRPARRPRPAAGRRRRRPAPARRRTSAGRPCLGIDEHAVPRRSPTSLLLAACSSSSRRKRRVITSCIAATSFWPSTPRITNRRYSLLRARPSSKTTIERDDLGALQVGDVVALDAQRRLGQVERLRDLLERLVAGGQVAGPLGLVQAERLARRCGRRSPAAPSCRRAAGPGATPGRRAARSSSCSRVAASGGSAGTRTSRGIASPDSPAYSWSRKSSTSSAVAALLDPVGDPAALAADPAAADVEDLHRDLERVLGERDHVGVGAVAEHHGLLLQRPAAARRGRRAAGRPARSPRPRRRRTSPSRAPDERGGVAGHEVAEVVDDARGAPRRSTRRRRARRTCRCSRAGRAGRSGRPA